MENTENSQTPEIRSGMLDRRVRRMRWYLVRWFVQWACLADAAIGIFTFGVWSGSISLMAEDWFLGITDDDFKRYGGYA